MKEGKSSVSNATSYEAMGEYWDDHDLDDAWDPSRKVDFEVNIQSEKHYYPIDSEMSHRIDRIARRRGIRAESLINMWLQEKLLQLREPSPGTA